jgi:hypothetical protein
MAAARKIRYLASPPPRVPRLKLKNSRELRARRALSELARRLGKPIPLMAAIRVTKLRVRARATALAPWKVLLLSDKKRRLSEVRRGETRDRKFRLFPLHRSQRGGEGEAGTGVSSERGTAQITANRAAASY